MAIQYPAMRSRSMSYKLSGQLITVCASLVTALVGGLYYDLAISILSPLGLRMLAISTWLLLLLSVILLALLFTSRLRKVDLERQIQVVTSEKNSEIDQLKSDLASYNPNHFGDKEFDKHFDELARKIDKENSL